MESLINYQEDLYTRITKAYSNFKKSPKERITKEYVEGKLEALDQYWCEFSAGHKELMRSTEPKILAATKYMKDEFYDKTEEVYFEYKCLIKKNISRYRDENVGQGGQTGSKSSHVKLPKINIQTFAGNYSDWPTFRDLFKSLIHNNYSLDNVQKLHYLKSHLAGEAELLLRHIPIVDTNYDRCWCMLEARYNNKRYLSHNILKRMLGQKNNVVESANGLKDLIDTTSECLEALSGLGIDVSTWDIIVIHIMTLKLDPETRRQWEFNLTDNINPDSLPTFVQFKDFITNRFRALEALDPKPKNVKGTHSFHVTDDQKGIHNNDVSVYCPYCKGNHKLYGCEKFIGEDWDARREFAQQSGICFICLGSNHTAKYCRSSFKCRICKRKHNTLLHPKGTTINKLDGSAKVFASTSEDINQETSVANVAEASEQLESSVITCYSSGQIPINKQVLLATAVVQTESSKGEVYMMRALLDQGSQASFVTEQVAQRLGLKRTSVAGIISGLEGNKSISVKHVVSLQIHPRFDSGTTIMVQAYILKSITTSLPSRKMVELNDINLSDMCLADPEYHMPNRIDILLGAEVYGQVIREGLKKNNEGSLIAQSTTLGWILSGSVSQAHSCHIASMHTLVEDNNILKMFWEQEAETTNKRKMLTQEENQCEEYFKLTTTRNKEGMYIVRLPFRNSNPTCQYGNSRKIAERRFRSLQLKLQKNDKFKNSYKEVINDYLKCGHMIQLKKNDKTQGVYLPHHAVIREDKDTTKVRVVYDASCKGMNGVSLNDNLMVGPTLQDDLRHILMRWRNFPICLVADVEKMYRQVNIHEDDQRFQRVLWSEQLEGEVGDYQLTTVTFGTSSAPFLAVRTLQQVAQDEGTKYPLAASKVASDFYMDDLMTGAEDEEEANQIYNQMNKLLSAGGFKLQKWSSNSEGLLRKINEGEKHDRKLKFKLDQIIKILGLTWNRDDDAFHYTVLLSPLKTPVTKRNILSDIARLYDPLGWLAPSIIIAKVLIQKLWLAGISWDTEVPDKISKEWYIYRSQLEMLRNIRIPRWMNTKSNVIKMELHGFCDASKTAYAAVVYLRVIDYAKNIHVSLISSKTKVAPIKQISIPRLELCGAVLLVRLMLEIADVLGLMKESLYAWTDSEVVLAWLHSNASRWQTFVANRVAEIQMSLDSHQWAHVQSKQNPADCASRGVAPEKLTETVIWFQGPTFLHHQNITFEKPKNVTTNLEEIKIKTHSALLELDLWGKYSTLPKLLRVIAFCKRFLLNCKNKKAAIKTNYLSSQEIEAALTVCIKKCQQEEFEHEIDSLSQNQVTSKGKRLKSFNVFIDEHGLLRVGGRLEQSTLTFNVKHPILIPKKSFLTKLLILDAHTNTLHGGPQLMLNYLYTKYWIIGVRVLVKDCVRKCVVCVRHNAVTKNQLMGQLPAARVTLNKPFHQTGVDYAGPVDIRTAKGRGHRAYKGYICLFVCMATRAVHLEAVSDLTSQGFLAAFKRFVARRGHCTDLYSDNGTNFVGAARELRQLLQAEKSTVASEIADWLSTNGTRWHFIPPHSPNFGGLWEAGIKSTKYHLKRVIGKTTLTFEEMSTVLSQIEACLNSRPLSKVSDEARDPPVLTPGHFLVGEPLVTVPDINYEISNVGSLRRWQLTQKILQDFWRRWSQEYLIQFLRRHKWADKNPEPQVGDVVLVKEDDLPPCRWLIGRVEEKHPGPDQITRVVTLRTKNSLIKRPTSKLCVLPVTQ